MKMTRWTKRDRAWEDMRNAQAEVNRLASMIGQIDIDQEPDRFNELREAHHRALNRRARAEAWWTEMITR